ncbi:MAG: SDR family NAD(P)-dependent oxidoreductase [Rhizobacter sp.]|nr:SDR family NAD(P)-dependent oxidoreductase [Chlorobiales bacterium]
MKTIIITGATAGIGFEAANFLLKQKKYNLIVGVRDAARGKAMTSRLIAETQNPNIQTLPTQVQTLPLDLSSLDSVRAFAEKISATEVYGFIGNAGIQHPEGLVRTSDGIEETFGVNHLAHFLLVNLLLKKYPALQRIVITASEVHDAAYKGALGISVPPPHYTTADAAAYPTDDGKSQVENQRRYSLSKLCNVFFVYELCRKLQQAGNQRITGNLFNPRLVPGTELARSFPPPIRFAWNNILPLFADRHPRVRSAARSGRDLAKLIDDDSITVSGKYFDADEITATSKESYDLGKAKELWDASVRLSHLKPDETIF